ncbi:hypothetical protein NC652_008590 [Populus alba x Populus x berolinensis]|nr:hypothetical protein NC652_008590 [Populus alba x Populus x berolinensis]
MLLKLFMNRFGSSFLCDVVQTVDAHPFITTDLIAERFFCLLWFLTNFSMNHPSHALCCSQYDVARCSSTCRSEMAAVN